MLAMTYGMAAVHCSQSLVEFELVEVCMHLGTKPFAKALHCCASLRMHLLLAQRAMPVKEPCEEM
jgi:hypothetical protein